MRMLRWLCGWVRFDQLDRDGSGYLQGDELLALVGWVWDSYHPKGQPLGKQHRVELRAMQSANLSWWPEIYRMIDRNSYNMNRRESNCGEE